MNGIRSLRTIYKTICICTKLQFNPNMLFVFPFYFLPVSPQHTLFTTLSFQGNHFLISFPDLNLSADLNEHRLRTFFSHKIFIFTSVQNNFLILFSCVTGYTEHFSRVLNSVNGLIWLQSLSISPRNLRLLFLLRAHK